MCFFRVLFDGAFAARAWAVRERAPELPRPRSKPRASVEPPLASESRDQEGKATKTKKLIEATRPQAIDDRRLREEGALWTIAILQREGRLVDFLKQDIASFADDEIGAAVRVVHAGCKKALDDHLSMEPIRSEDEGSKITLEKGFDKNAHKLVGDVRGSAPYNGVLRHKGWRAKDLELPTPTAGHDPSILCAAEVEL